MARREGAPEGWYRSLAWPLELVGLERRYPRGLGRGSMFFKAFAHISKIYPKWFYKYPKWIFIKHTVQRHSVVFISSNGLSCTQDLNLQAITARIDPREEPIMTVTGFKTSFATACAGVAFFAAGVPGHGYKTARCAGHAAILTPVAASGSRAFCSALI